MHQHSTSFTFVGRAVVTALAFTLSSVPVLADKPEWAGGGGKHGGKHEARQDRDDDHGGKGGKGDHGGKGGKGDHGGKGERREARVGGYFVDQDRVVVGQYYEQQYRGGKKCPPGLAKKNNGCMPPGQAKQYVVGQQLPSTIVYYPVPQPVLLQLPPPPPQHRYVQVSGDILLLAIGSSMVVDALGGLLR